MQYKNKIKSNKYTKSNKKINLIKINLNKNKLELCNYFNYHFFKPIIFHNNFLNNILTNI